MADLDPLAAVDQDDPKPLEISDPDHSDYRKPAAGIAPLGGGK